MMTITAKQGSTLDLPIQVSKNGVPMDISGRTLVYLVKAAQPDADGAAVLSFTQGNGLTVTDPTNGWYKLTRPAAEFTTAPGKYLGALQITGGGEVIEIPDDGVFDVWIIFKQLVQTTS